MCEEPMTTADVRSALCLVHGTARLRDAGYDSFRQLARDLTSRLLVKALRERWPTPQQLDELVLT